VMRKIFGPKREEIMGLKKIDGSPPHILVS
jgi:hypothetical protein